MSSESMPTHFSRHLWLTLLACIVFSIGFAKYIAAEKAIDRANDLRFQSHALVDELRQSSDDLTRMVRSYVATGNPIYKQHYQEILDIRDGKRPRPLNYQNVYWDLVMADDRRPSGFGPAITLLDMMRSVNFTGEEFAKLAEAKTNSDALTKIEFAAMQLVESTSPITAANRLKATELVQGVNYHQAKAAIMRPISEAHTLMDIRTTTAVDEADSVAHTIRVILLLCGALLFITLWRTFRALNATLGGSVDMLHKHLANLGSGDFSAPIRISPGSQSSVLAWVAETQTKLNLLEHERTLTESKNRRLTQLYAALSQCNQAIVRCINQEDLFPQICRDAVNFGGMKMAWIGLLDKAEQRVNPVASFGVGSEYVNGIHISVDADSPRGRGPTGTAIREDRPSWCQDFQHDPLTAPWHERAAPYGWQASASLPLHCQGNVVGSFTLYAGELDAFDEAAQNLLVEMALDISFALDRFADTTERLRIEHALRESEQVSRTTFNQAAVGIARIGLDGAWLEVNQRLCDIIGYSKDELMLLTFQDITYPEDLDMDMSQVRDMLSGKIETYSMEKRYFHKSGEAIWANLTVTLVREQDGSPKYFISVIEDINPRKLAESKLIKLSLAVEQSPNTIVITDLDANIEYVNANFTKVTGYTLEEAVGQNPRVLQSGKTDPAIYTDLWAHLMRGEVWSGELINRRKDGSEYVELAMISPVRQPNGQITNYLAIKEDITDKKLAAAQIQQLAHFDQLTGLPNRSFLQERFKYAFSLAERSHENLAVLFLDLDHFKDINDTLGHSIGDQVLKEVSKRLKACLREEDTVSRLGGDEFILVLPGADANGAARVAGKLIESVSQPCEIEQHELTITPSIGIAIYPHDGDDFETLLKNADTAMYRVKEATHNDFRFFTTEMQAHSARTLQLANALRHALSRNELYLLYQPQISMDGHVIGVEALLRWQHPQLGLISPAEFIPVAEDSGQIIQIGEWVMRTAVKQLKAWLDSGLPPMMVAVNLSAAQFRQSNLVELVTSILDETQLPPKLLEIELTEAVAMDDPQAAIAVMDKLHENNIKMSIDDFGTGYSSLNYLKRFKVYKLKIDQSFIRDIPQDAEDKAIVTAIINMASSLGMHTIAEGVETADQLAFLRLQGCSEVQGYYFSKPIPPEQIPQFVRNSNRSLAQ